MDSDDRDGPSEEEVDHEEQTVAGGWWQPADGGDKKPERRAHERFAFTTRVQLVPSDGEMLLCEAMDLGLGGMLLRTANPALPGIGQLVEVELIEKQSGGVTFDGEVIRHGSDKPDCFAIRFVNLDNRLRGVLRSLVGEDEETTGTTYGLGSEEE